MRRIFHKKSFWSIFCLLCGLFLIGLFVYIGFADKTAGNGIYAGICVGIFICACSLIALSYSTIPVVQIEENHIFARYHWFGKLDCPISDVEFVLPQINTLTVLLKNGKRHVITVVEDSWQISSAIRKQAFTIEKESPERLRQKLNEEKDARKKDLFWVLGASVTLFANILIAVFLTGGRDFHEFGQQDWIVLGLMGVMELITIVVLFYMAQRCGKRVLPIEQLKYRLQGAVIISPPLPPGKVRCVLTDENFYGRIIVCGFPNDDGVYFSIQEFTHDFNLETVYTSEIYEDEADLPFEDISSFMDISTQFL